MQEQWNPLITALVSTIAIAVQVASNLVCEFVSVEAFDGEILAITETSGQETQSSTNIGLNCDGDFYSMGDDKMWKIANIFSLTALVVGVTTFLLSWSLVAISPTIVLWKSIAVAASSSAMLQVPAFVVFESYPCSDFQEQQECKLATGSYLVIVSVVIWIAVTALTQFLDPPMWREQLHLWKIPDRPTGETASDQGVHYDDDDDDDDERDEEMETGSQDPVFAAAFEKSDNLPQHNDRNVLGRVKNLFGRNASKASSDGSVDHGRVVQSFSFAVPADVKNTAIRLNQAHHGEEIVDVDEYGNNEVVESSDGVSDVIDDGVTGPMPQPLAPIITADESILDTITGEESLLDGHNEESRARSRDTPRPSFGVETVNGAPVYESLFNQDEEEENEHSTVSIHKASLSRMAYESMKREEEEAKKAEAKAALNGAPIYESLMNEDENNDGQAESVFTGPLLVKLNDNKDAPVKSAETEPEPTPVLEMMKTERSAPEQEEMSPPREPTPRGLFAMVQRRNRNYQHMIENDSVSPMRDAPPMQEIAIDNDAAISGGDTSVERGLLNDWNRMFDMDRIAATVSDGESSLNDDENFAVDQQRPPDTSDDEADAEKYDASSEYEEPGESSAAEGFLTSENEEADDEEEDEEEPEESPVRKVLRPPRKPKRHNHGGSVSSAADHSLLSYTIEEETEEDLRNDSDNYKSPPRLHPDEVAPGIRRTNSVPNLASYGSPTQIKGVAEDVTNTQGMNSYHSVELHREDHGGDKSLLSGMESTMTGPQLMAPQSPTSLVSGMESTMTGPQLLPQERGREQLNTETPEPSPLRKKRSKSLELRPKTTSDGNVWKSEREIRKGIHQATTYVTSDDSSSDEMSFTGGAEKARLARIQRLQNHNMSKTRTPVKTYDSYMGAQYFSRRAHVVSPEPSSEDVSTASRSDIDAAESFLLDTVDVSLAQLARNTDDEYGSEENSI